MFCPYCGNPCAEDHKFCFRCGKPLPEVLETASAVIPAKPEALEPAPAAEAVPAAETPDVSSELLSETAAAASLISEYVEITPPTEPAPTASVPQQAPKGRLWPPILALCVMICIGLAAFFLLPKATAPARSCFSVENGVLYFDTTLYTGGEELTVPAAVDGMTVTAISENCFADCDNLTAIILPDTVTVIGDNAFAGCDSLRGIYLPEGLLSIGIGALSNCPALEAVYFPGSLSEIGTGCLDGCNGLRYILYGGTYSQWRRLYDGTFRSGVELHTSDGTFYAQP